jgi:hypothetical protein
MYFFKFFNTVNILEKHAFSALFSPVLASFEDCQALPICCLDKSSTKMKVSMWHCWNDTDKKKTKYLEKNL